MRLNEKQNISRKQLPGNNDYLAPEQDEIEVSLFGPGYGESVLLHIGYNQWVIVDSCIEPVSEFPAPISYLRRINVDPAIAVKQIIATHWHDDHVRGLAEAFKECKSAEFVCSVAQTTKEFFTLVAVYGARSMIESTGVKEFSEILEILRNRGTKNKFISPKFAVEGRCLWQRNTKPGDQSQPCAIYALSPSDASVLLAQIGLSKLIPQVGETKKRVPSLGPNHSSVVLLVTIGQDSILLGADLEETGNSNTGWMAIINSGTRPKEKASFFKIPHHGSVTADNPQVWSLMLRSKPISSLTPFATGKVFLPTKDDVVRICNNTDKAFATSIPKHPKSRSRPKMVEKQLKEMRIKLRSVYCSPGQVRARGCYIDEKINWTVQLLGGAIELKDIYH